MGWNFVVLARNSFCLWITYNSLVAMIILRGSSVGVRRLGGLPNGHRFKSPHGHWKFYPGCYIQDPVGLVKVHANWFGHPQLSKKKKIV